MHELWDMSGAHIGTPNSTWTHPHYTYYANGADNTYGTHNAHYTYRTHYTYNAYSATYYAYDACLLYTSDAADE